MHVSPFLFGEAGFFGGAERYVLELARHMAEQTPTTLVSFGRTAREESMGALKIRVLGGTHHVRGNIGNPLTWELWGALRSADVIHCHQQHILASSLAAVFARLTGRRAFVTDLGGGAWDISAYVSTDRWYHGHLHISEYSRRIFGQTELARAHVIYGGVDTERFAPAPGTPRDGRTVFVGRLMPHKGVNYLVEAAEDGLPVELIGRPYAPEFTTYLRELAQGKPVTFRHDLDDAGIVDAYRRAQCVVLPSVYRPWGGGETTVPELLGQTLLEGMACGTPAICTDVASMPEIVRDGETGFVVPPNDAAALRDRLRWLRDHPAEVERMGANARRDVLERFTWPQVVRHCLAVYTAP